jgi:hypothetical protein
MVSGITPCARECKWIVYFGETPKDMVKNNFPTYLSCRMLVAGEVLAQGVEHGGVCSRDRREDAALF